MTHKGTVIKNILINATVPKVWEAFTNPNITKRYFFDCEVHSNFNIGDEIEFTLDKNGSKIICVKGLITFCIKEKLLAYTCFTPDTENQPEKHTLVTIALVPEGLRTQLTITQGNFKADKQRFSESNEAWNFVLNGLKTLLET